jgi:hypothetical protein
MGCQAEMEDQVPDGEVPSARHPQSRLWQILLLLPLPPLSFFYLHLVRAGRVSPSFLPVLVLASLPVLSIFLASRRLGASPVAERPGSGEIALIAIAITELAWALVSGVAVGMAMLRGS